VNETNSAIDGIGLKQDSESANSDAPNMESGRLNKSSGRQFVQTEVAVDTDRKPDYSIGDEEFKRKI